MPKESDRQRLREKYRNLKEYDEAVRIAGSVNALAASLNIHPKTMTAFRKELRTCKQLVHHNEREIIPTNKEINKRIQALVLEVRGEINGVITSKIDIEHYEKTKEIREIKEDEGMAQNIAAERHEVACERSNGAGACDCLGQSEKGATVTQETLWKDIEEKAAVLHRMYLEEAEKKFQKRMAGVLGGC